MFTQMASHSALMELELRFLGHVGKGDGSGFHPNTPAILTVLALPHP